ncbi:hypothetical protein D3C80_1581880 [compost metagenome]
MEHILGADFCYDTADDLIVFGPQVGEWGNQATCADARDDLERRAGAMLAPANQQPCSKCPGIATSGHRQHVGQRQDIGGLARPGQDGGLTPGRLDNIAHVGRQVAIDPVTCIGNAGNDGFFRQGRRYSVTTRQARLQQHVQRCGTRPERECFHNLSSGA